jgi:hypothetical protein
MVVGGTSLDFYHTVTLFQGTISIMFMYPIILKLLSSLIVLCLIIYLFSFLINVIYFYDSFYR